MTIYLSEYSVNESITSCKFGHLDGIDYVVFIGSINTSSVDLFSRRLVLFEVKRINSEYFIPICSVDLFNVTCATRFNYSCYCRKQSNSQYELVLNQTASIPYSQGYLRLNWPSNFIGRNDMSNIVTMPMVYDAVTQKLTINGREIPVGTSKDLPLEPNSVLMWCVTNLLSHTLEISTTSVLNASTSDCVTHTFEFRQSTFRFILSYRELGGCQRNNSFTGCCSKQA
ncbi:hypothetical protein Btru_038645 [Bulinus truncatus]|nr:hypothetical protein Btru_038645 [Bulinus truncatus]